MPLVHLRFRRAEMRQCVTNDDAAALFAVYNEVRFEIDRVFSLAFAQLRFWILVRVLNYLMVSVWLNTFKVSGT